MRRKLRKMVGVLLAAGLVMSSFTPWGILETQAETETETPAETQKVYDLNNASLQEPFQVLTGEEMMEDMGAGWNLGNTMDGHTGFTPGELIWQHVKTTKKLIKQVHDLGFNTVRVPVTWGTMIDDENDYAINEAWISRVQDIVDYCISQDMFVIVNIHHDGAEQSGWLRIATEDQEGLAKKFEGVWRNIATPFKDYDEHLIFESMNEVKGMNMTTLQENQVVMKLNQIFVDTVRSTGSNNAKRWLMVPGKYNYIDSICNSAHKFELPKDSVDNRIMLSIHDYTPWTFCGEKSKGAESYRTYSQERLTANDTELKPLYDTYTSKGIPVIVGEYGCVNKDNTSERAFYLEGLNRMFRKYKLVGVYWDQGWYDRSQTPDYSFSIIDRNTGKPIDKCITDGILRAKFGPEEDYTTLTKDPAVTKMTSIKLSQKSASLSIGESKTITAGFAPTKSNDVILWKTNDPTVATVYNGKINGKGAGTTTITAFSQSGSVSATMKVTVLPDARASFTEKLSLPVESLSMKQNETAFLNPVLTSDIEGESLYYRSSNEAVVTVSSVGKLVAIGAGSAIVTVHTTTGKKKEVKVTVGSAVSSTAVRLSLNVYYNDVDHQYFSNEISNDIISVEKDGQYSLTFDCTKDLSKEAVAAGVTSLSNLTAIYIKDYDVATGNASKSPLTSCKIRYDKIIVDDTELTVTSNTFKSALKDSGIFDTNDPINGWDGSVVKEIEAPGNVANFSTVKDPKKITIQFTLDQLVFEGAKNPGSSGTPTSKPPVTNKPVVKKGSVHKIGQGNYKVTSVGSNKTVTYTKPVKKTQKKVTIPASVKIGGVSYQVTAIGNSALKSAKVTSVTIGKNVKTIGKQAFYGCKKVKTITIKTTKLTSKKIGSKAFAKMNAKVKIKVPKSKLKAYKKLLKKRGVTGKKQKIVK